MAGFRALKDEMRRGVHSTFEIPAFYLPPDSAPPHNDKIACSVRLHGESQMVGDIKGTSFDFATRSERVSRVLVLMEELPAPEINAIFSVATGEAYSIQNTDDPDGITRTTHVSRVPLGETAGLPVPPPET